MPRDHLKTSHVTISGTLQKVVQNPEHRIAIFNAIAKKATNMLLGIRSIVDSNALFRALYSDIIPSETKRGIRWNQEGLDFLRQGVYQDPTISAYGLEGTATSSHFTHQVWDDPIEEDAYKSPNVMADAITRMSGITALMDNHTVDTAWLVGTRWALHDVYSHYMRAWKGRCSVLVRSIVEGGSIIFPEKMGTFEDIGFLQSTYTPYRWSCWYMNSPRDDQLQTFNVQDLKYWAWSADEREVILYDKDGHESARWPLTKLDITCTVDLAPAEKATDDENAVTVTGVTPHGQVIVLDEWGARGTPDKVIDHLFYVKRRFNPRAFGIEDVAYQKVFKWFLRLQANAEGLWFNVVPIKAINKKELRIEGLQPLAAVGRLWVHPSHYLLVQQALEFPLGKHDDRLDSLSMHLQLWRGVMDHKRWAKLQEAERAVVQKILTNGAPPRDNIEREIAQMLPRGYQSHQMQRLLRLVS
jgi:predicted phage terminase large subunit-like protein